MRLWLLMRIGWLVKRTQGGKVVVPELAEVLVYDPSPEKELTVPNYSSQAESELAIRTGPENH